MRKLLTVALGLVLVFMLGAAPAPAEGPCRRPGTPQEAEALAQRAAPSTCAGWVPRRPLPASSIPLPASWSATSMFSSSTWRV